MDSTTAAILAAIITGGLSLIGVILSNRAASSRMQASWKAAGHHRHQAGRADKCCKYSNFLTAF